MSMSELELMQRLEELRQGRGPGRSFNVNLSGGTTVGPQPYSAGRPDLTAVADGPAPLRNMVASKAAAPGYRGYVQAIDPSGIMRDTEKVTRRTLNRIPGMNKGASRVVGRFAGRAIPVLSVLGNLSDVGDIVTGDESAANKLMDTAAMGIGGTAGFLLGGGPLGASLGASTGKMISDGTQWLFGDKKTAEQRKLEELQQALALLNRGGL